MEMLGRQALSMRRAVDMSKMGTKGKVTWDLTDVICNCPSACSGMLIPETGLVKNCDRILTDGKSIGS